VPYHKTQIDKEEKVKRVVASAWKKKVDVLERDMLKDNLAQLT
jgi:hypothetical protein